MKNIFLDDPSLLFEIRQGIERECLRTEINGCAALTKHPVALGSKLTHAYITTDYSENLLEFITKVHSSTTSLVDELESIHAFTQQNIGDELLWTSSMPSILPADDQIPLACYGKSNVGKLKTLYRNGLGHRYGRSMQSIAGVHYNFSMSDNFWELLKKEEKSSQDLKDFKDTKYFHLIRNFQRYRWMLVYLFGATPVVDKSFLEGKKHNLEPLGNDTFYSPYGTSLRMGGLGYTSSAQSNIGICYNKVQSYIKTLEEARLTSYEDYEKIGLKTNGVYNQLNTNLLQIDNEFYSTIRPKNVAKSKESALKALHNRGIEYIEVRLIDVDPFSPIGISSERIHFLHLFLLWCLTKDSPEISSDECQELDFNFDQVVLKGRVEGLKLKKKGEDIEMLSYISELMGEISTLANSFKDIEPFYAIAMDKQLRKIEKKENLPSQVVLDSFGGKSFIEFHLDLAKDFKGKLELSTKWREKLEKCSQQSVIEQAKIESEDKLEFDQFLKTYFDEIKIDLKKGS
jgi:glutamate--cysteine ligase